METVKELMKIGILVDPDSIEKLKTLNSDNLKLVIDKTKEERPLVLTPEIIEIYLKVTNFKMIKQFDKKQTFTVQDIVDQLNKRYDFIQNLLMRKVEISNIVSINKCESGKLTVI